jgi:hypothetical protein
MDDWGLARPSDLFGPATNRPLKSEIIELVGPHLRVSGTISLIRFPRLSDLVNHSRGYLRLTEAQLLRRNGDPTGLYVQDLMVSLDEVTFVGQRPEEVRSDKSGLIGGMDRPLMERVLRQLVIFTPGHTLVGGVHMFAETEIDAFVESTDPRFVPMIDVTARSLADRRVISHFALALVNRTQITAASLLEQAGTAAETGMDVD